MGEVRFVGWVKPVLLFGLVILGLGQGALQAQRPKLEDRVHGAQPFPSKANNPSLQVPLQPGALLRVTMSNPLNWAEWHAGSWMEADFPGPVYSNGKVVIPARSRLVFEIDQVQITRDKSQHHRPRPSTVHELVQSLFQKEKAHVVSFRTAAVISPSGSVTPVHASILSTGDLAPVRQSKKKEEGGGGSTGDQGQAKKSFGHSRYAGLILKLEQPAVFPSISSATFRTLEDSDEPAKIRAGTQARLMLMSGLSASGNRNGDTFQARLVEPIFLDDGRVLPEGALLEGRITRRVPPRCLNRGGKLHFAFVRMTLPSGYSTPISASLSGSEGEATTPLTLDSEGSVSASKQGKAAILLNVGTSWLLGKIVDDIVEETFKFSVEAVASGTAATYARYVGMGVGVALIALQHGQDVRLPQYSELEVTFNRSVALAPAKAGHEAGLPLDSNSEEFGTPISLPAVNEMKPDAVSN
ncbi:MAG TPA: hypothetical protein VMW38_12715 [Terriglobia bacterium]|nr:hypothetical protein [Terriglobia bacterium]